MLLDKDGEKSCVDGAAGVKAKTEANDVDAGVVLWDFMIMVVWKHAMCSLDNEDDGAKTQNSAEEVMAGFQYAIGCGVDKVGNGRVRGNKSWD